MLHDEADPTDNGLWETRNSAKDQYAFVCERGTVNDDKLLKANTTSVFLSVARVYNQFFTSL